MYNGGKPLSMCKTWSFPQISPMFFQTNSISTYKNWGGFGGIQIGKYTTVTLSIPGVTCTYTHGENGGTLELVAVIINPIYTLYKGYLLGISPFKGLFGGLNSKGPSIPRVRVPPFSL